MFISYAQNFEDVILNRIFKDKESGFYIDVGANHPIHDSVTMAFYQRGWRGINIEPMVKEFELLQTERPLDVNLNLAISNQTSLNGKQTFFDLQGTGFSTLDQSVANALVQEHNLSVNLYDVSVCSLAEVCQEWVKQPIDFLKIDVEGWEESVICSHDWQNFRPTVVIVEATIPGHRNYRPTNIPNILATEGYQKVYFDGLNDFYLAQESSDLSKYFQLPPNIFDEFQTFRYLDMKHHADNLLVTLSQRDQEIQHLKDHRLDLNSLLKNPSEVADVLPNKLIQENAILRNYLLDEKFETRRLNNELKMIDKRYQQQVQSLKASMKKLMENVSDAYRIQQNLNAQLQTMQKTVVAMETSKFWRLRKAWFRVKHKLGLPVD